LSELGWDPFVHHPRGLEPAAIGLAPVGLMNWTSSSLRLLQTLRERAEREKAARKGGQTRRAPAARAGVLGPFMQMVARCPHGIQGWPPRGQGHRR